MLRTFFFLSVLVLILSARFAFFYQNKIEYRVGDRVEFDYTFLKEPWIMFGKQIFTVSNIKIYAPDEPALHYGDKVRIIGEVEEEHFKNAKGNEIVQLAIRHPEVKLSEKVFGLSFISHMRDRINASFNRSLNRDDASLLMGIVFGIRQDMDKSFSLALRNTGVLHVVAASGANVSMVGGFLLAVFALFLKRQWAIASACFAIIFYAVFSGLDPSIVRASVMAVFAYSAGVFGRQNTPLITLSIAAFLMLFYNPELLSDAGFQLSYASTLGILYIKPVFSRLPKSLTAITEDFTTTFAAQLASLPILVITFSVFSPISVLVNLLVLWTVPLLMIGGGLASIFALLNPVLAQPFLYLSLPLLWFFEKVVILGNQIAKPIELNSIPLSLVLGYYFVLVSLVLLIQKRFKNKDSRIMTGKQGFSSDKS